MQPITVSVRIDRPPDEVFAFLDDLSNHERFTDHMLVDWTCRARPPAWAPRRACARRSPARRTGSSSR